MLELGLQKFRNMWSKRKVEHVSCSDLQHVLQTLGEKLSADETQATQKIYRWISLHFKTRKWKRKSYHLAKGDIGGVLKPNRTSRISFKSELLIITYSNVSGTLIEENRNSPSFTKSSAGVNQRGGLRRGRKRKLWRVHHHALQGEILSIILFLWL